MNNLFDINGKTALVTGSSRGLGLTLAKGLAQAGANVILNGRNPETLAQAADALKSEGLDCTTCAFDVTKADEVEAGIAAIKKQNGPVDILVNNAGIQIRGPLEDFEPEDWQKILTANLTSAFLVTKYIVPDMIQRKAGKIINICSMQSELGRPTIAPYAASKGGLKMLTRAMATEWGKHNIQANAIGPGYFETDMTRKLVEDKDFNAWLCARTPSNRWGKPEELIGAAIFLASKASSYINGHILYVDGGMLACV